MELIVGIGYDSHRLSKYRKMYIGGIEIPYEYGLEGHSDADVLIHAIIDALLGAAGLGNIGTLFPDTDKRYKDIRSTLLLEETVKRVQKDGWEIVNIDSIVFAELPKLNPFIQRIREELSKIMNIKISFINIKAKTNEGMGFVGRHEGIAALAVVLLKRGEVNE